MLDNLYLTLFIYITIVFGFVTSYYGYWTLSPLKMYRIERGNMMLDWRFWVPCLLYAFLLGYRYDFAYDWEQYQQTFIYIQKGVAYKETTEHGYLLINRLLGLLGGDYYSIFILEGFFWIYSICYMTKYNRRAWLFILPIVFIEHRFRCLNLSRQHFAMSLLYVGYGGLLSGKKMWFWIWGLIGCSVHTSCILWVLPFYFSYALRKYLKLPKLSYTLILYFVTLIMSEIILDELFKTVDAVGTISSFTGSQTYTTDIIQSERFQWDNLSMSKLFANGVKDVGYILLFYKFNKLNELKIAEYITLFVGLISIYFRLFTATNEITSRFFLYPVVLYNIGLGILTYKCLVNYRKIDPLYFIFPVFILLYSVYFLVTVTIFEFSQGNYIEYKLF